VLTDGVVDHDEVSWTLGVEPNRRHTVQPYTFAEIILHVKDVKERLHSLDALGSPDGFLV
jgi:hypothetical protein